jgi:mannose-6-phosphate isomerase-like protein (cupin superfamily)
VEKVDLAHKLSLFTERWTPKVVAELNGQHVKLAKLEGAFTWHSHASEDELFLVLSGRLRMELRDRDPVELTAGQLLVVPRGVEHRPVADGEVHVLLFEPAGTLNTGDADDTRACPQPERL